MNAFEVLKAAAAGKKRQERADGEAQVNKHKRYESEKRSRTFVEKWREGRPWLIFENERMYCTWCKDNGVVESNFVKGTTNFASNYSCFYLASENYFGLVDWSSPLALLASELKKFS